MILYFEINPLNAELNPICHFLALLVAHHILHVSRIRINVDSAGGCVYLRDLLRWSCNSVDISLPLSLRFWTVSP